jgi:hypothetical protein
MLDPWVRVPLTLADSKTGKYKADFWVFFLIKFKGTTKGRYLPIQDYLQEARI